MPTCSNRGKKKLHFLSLAELGLTKAQKTRIKIKSAGLRCGLEDVTDSTDSTSVDDDDVCDVDDVTHLIRLRHFSVDGKIWSCSLRQTGTSARPISVRREEKQEGQENFLARRRIDGCRVVSREMQFVFGRYPDQRLK